MRDNRTAAHKVGECRDGLDGRRSICHIGVRNAREFGNLGGNQLLGVHEGIEPVDDLAARKTGSRDLNQFIVLHRKTRGLGIEDDYVLLDEAKRLRLSALGERGVRIDDELRRSRRYGVLD